MQIWEYLDGTLNNENDRQRITYLIGHDSVWQQKHQELLSFHVSLSMHIGNDMPSMGFDRNVMEAIAQNKIARPAQRYINPAIIRSIAAVFILGLVICLIYACIKANWTLQDNSWMDAISGPFKELSIKSYSGAFINIFIGINIILALLLGDKLLHKKPYTKTVYTSK
ncbi:MAG TPA: hypothetical protein VHA52_07895 [Candidatus Babeliaceae bacterium]|nr:hypothetical protein [Candidatus Babeliaceae bacterium]